MKFNIEFINKILKSEGRSQEVVRNILLSLGTKGISIITSLLIVPLTINYVNPSQYGIWLTLSSIVAWISYFDLGIGNGFRNRFTEAQTKGDVKLAREYVSTTYFAVTCIVSAIFISVMIANRYISWDTLLKVDFIYRAELKRVFTIIGAFFCLNMVVRLFGTLLTADQKPGVASIINCVGDVFSLAVVFVLTKVSDGSLTSLALYYTGVSFLVMLVSSLYAFVFTSYRKYAPNPAFIRPKLIKNILSLGVQFFIISISMLVLFQVINIIISREIGPEAVTQYNITFKYYNILHMIMTIIIVPFWSAFTDAFFKDDFNWMRNTVRKLEICWYVEIGFGIIMLFIGPFFFKLWVGDSVSVDTKLSIAMLIYAVVQSIGAIYMNILNGLGKIRIQLIIYCLFAVVAWPMLVMTCRKFGLQGVLILPSALFIFQAILGKVQVNKLINKSANGIWNK
ncbi:O-antigen export protein [Flavobacterium ammoniigenes]|jgi:O-antigen/teichoic acid export membrane protein|uniref:O-antigen export protein n=1 Tax=Flavobacterium ammoniigenes TaxID=1751095 RepID=A0ABM7V564_9FLAO|nr:oligosaccharide flippase family protein [Flavobacterium ammoniigenes]BDB54715.1 O-antigen export protein [Flavobacterium ammoniigenes]